MTFPLLLTSFTTWLPHQRSNSSDDLVAAFSEFSTLEMPLICLRKLPVETETASDMVIREIQETRLQGIICCGMAEGRSLLTVESRATQQGKAVYTSVDLGKLLAGTSHTEISHDAGNFVCEGLYFSVLNYLQQNHLNLPCIFVHVPRFTVESFPLIFEDFQKIVQNLSLISENLKF